jgi:hypothetical protein
MIVRLWKISLTSCRHHGLFINRRGICDIENHSLIADTAGHFAKKIRLLYQDKTAWQKYSAGDRDLIDRYYTEEAARKLPVEILPVKT